MTTKTPNPGDSVPPEIADKIGKRIADMIRADEQSDRDQPIEQAS